MQIKRTNLRLKKLMCEKESYDIFFNCHKDMFVFFNVGKFEKFLLDQDPSPMSEIHLIHMVKQELDELDKNKPLLEYKDKGTHYAFELFLTNPGNWTSNAEPYLWAYISRKFSDDLLPMSKEEFKKKYMEIIKYFNIPYGEDKSIVLDRFTLGDMSNGLVSGMFVKIALDILLERLETYEKTH